MPLSSLTKMVVEEKTAMIPSLDAHALQASIGQMTEFYRIVLSEGWEIRDPKLTATKRVQVTLHREIPAWKALLESAI
jgi:hypothetical protein